MRLVESESISYLTSWNVWLVYRKIVLVSGRIPINQQIAVELFFHLARGHVDTIKMSIFILPNYIVILASRTQNRNISHLPQSHSNRHKQVAILLDLSPSFYKVQTVQLEPVFKDI